MATIEEIKKAAAEEVKNMEALIAQAEAEENNKDIMADVVAAATAALEAGEKVKKSSRKPDVTAAYNLLVQNAENAKAIYSTISNSNNEEQENKQNDPAKDGADDGLKQDTPDKNNENRQYDDTPTETGVKELEEVGQYVYIGPTLKKEGIPESMIFLGSLNDIYKRFGDIMQEKPKIKQLIVESQYLSLKQNEKAKKGTLLNRVYEDLKK